MKNITRILAVFILCLSGTVTSQNERPIEELLEVLSQNHMGSISDVFNQGELLLLKNHFGQANADENSIENLDLDIFGTENQTRSFGNIDSEDPTTFNTIAKSPVQDFEGAGVYNPFDGLFYVIDDGHNVWAVDPFTGIYISAGMITPPTGETFTGLAFDPITGTLFGLSTNGVGTSTLSTINLNTLAVTPIGVTGMVLAIALAISNNGILLAVDLDNDILHSINRITGLASIIGHIGFDANFGAAMFRNAITGLIYLTAYNVAVGDSELRILDLVTGLTILVGVIIVATLAQMAWGAFQQSFLGTEDLGLDNFAIYPNPASNIINLNANTQIDNLEIYSMLGQKIISQEIMGLSGEVDVSRLQTGSYILKAIAENKTEVLKFIKQ